MAKVVNLEAAIEFDTAQHYLDSPKHADSVLLQLFGLVQSLRQHLNDDPLLAAYQIRDMLPDAYGYLHDLNRWSYAVREATPDDLPTNGARLCHS